MSQIPRRQWELIGKSLLWAYSGPVAERYRVYETAVAHPVLRRLIKGSLRLEWSDQTLEVPEGSWVLIPPFHFRHRFSDDAEITSIAFVLNTSSNLSLLTLSSPKLLDGKGVRLHAKSEALVRAVKASYGIQAPGSISGEGGIREHLRVEACFLNFLEALFEQLRDEPLDVAMRIDPRIQQCVLHVHQSPLSRRHSERDLAQLSGLSVSQLNRLFLEAFAMTPKAWLDSFLLDQSRRLLSEPGPIKQVAYALGFSSPQHFSSWFLRHAGVTPREWKSGKRTQAG